MRETIIEWGMQMKEKSSSAVGIIGGADGPTSVFVAGRTGKLPLKIGIKNHIYKWKSKKVQKSIVAGAHTLEEVVAYADEKYHLTEVTESQRKYVEQRKCLKESLVSRYKPELLGDLKEVKRPEIYTEDSVKELQRQFFARREMIDRIPDEKMPMDFHIYEISSGRARLEMEIDYRWDVFGISYSGSKKEMKQFKRIARDLYFYYGVSEEDIKNKTDRYHSLLATLSA